MDETKKNIEQHFQAKVSNFDEKKPTDLKPKIIEEETEAPKKKKEKKFHYHDIFKFVILFNTLLLIYLMLNVSMLYIQYPEPASFGEVLVKSGYLAIYLQAIFVAIILDVAFFVYSLAKK